MLKWLGGCLLVVIIVVVVGGYWGFKTMRGSLEPDGSARVAIAGTPQRVFAALANADSIKTWMSPGTNVTISQPGPLVPGSRIRVSMRSRTGIPQQPMEWIVRQVVADQLIVRELITDKGQRVAVERDSLSAAGDSTVVVSRVGSPMIDSIMVARQKKTGDSTSGYAGVTGDIMLSMFQIQAKLELQSLKSHIEGKPLKR